MKDLIFLSLNNIRRRKLRSLLAIVGIFIGISAVVSLISLSQGLSESVSEEFKKIGTDKILVTSGSGFGPSPALQQKLTNHDLEIIKNTKGVEIAAGVITRLINVKFKEKTSTVPFHGLSLEKDELKLIEEIENLEFVKGHQLKKSNNNKAIIGYRLWNENTFFGKKLKLNDKIEIEGKKFEVVGLLKKIGSPFEDAHVYLDLKETQDLFNLNNQYDVIFVRTGKNLLPSEVAEKIEENMRKDRNLKKGNEDFSVETFENIVSSFNSIFSIIQIVVVGIVSISLIVGAIGIMNTMYTAVLERTKEIGIMKAVGAKNHHILIIFLFESAILGLVGGFLGIIAGISLSKLVEFLGQKSTTSILIKTSITPELIFFTLIFSTLIGAISGVLPALQASKLKPVDALRYE